MKGGGLPLTCSSCVCPSQPGLTPQGGWGLGEVTSIGPFVLASYPLVDLLPRRSWYLLASSLTPKVSQSDPASYSVLSPGYSWPFH